MKHQVLIASYAKDFPWLGPCLKSLKQFSRGFLSPVVVVTSEDYLAAIDVAREYNAEALVRVKDGPKEHGFLRAQIVMMMGDVFCPEADMVHLWGSDCFAFTEFTPEHFMRNGKAEMLVNSYDFLRVHHPSTLCWLPGVERILRMTPKHEYMRRIPLLYPKELYQPFRTFVEYLHGKSFEAVIYGNAEFKDCSESNLLGAYAWENTRDAYEWIDMDFDEVTGCHLKTVDLLHPSPVAQFWSHGGLDLVCDRYNTLPDGSNTFGRTARDTMGLVFSGQVKAATKS